MKSNLSKSKKPFCCKSKCRKRDLESGIKFDSEEKLIHGNDSRVSSYSTMSTAQSVLSELNLILSKDSKKDSSDPQTNDLYQYQKEIQTKCDEECYTKKHLTINIVNKYFTVKTKNNVDLASIVFMKTIYPEAPCPYAIDDESYVTFEDFFRPLILDLQNISELTDINQSLKYGDLDAYDDLDLNEEKEKLQVMYCDIVVRRNLHEHNLAGCMTNEERKIIKDLLKAKCQETFSSLSRMTIPDEWAIRLIKDKPYLLESKAMSNYPNDRVTLVYKDNLDCNTGAIINFDDHLQIVVSTNNGKLGHIYNEANKILKSVAISKLPFQRHHQYGYITYSPQFLGTGLTIRMILKLPYIYLMEDVENIYLKDLGLSLNSIEHSEVGLVILSNRQTISISEVEIFQNILNGYRRLQDLEIELEYTYAIAVPDKTMPVESLKLLLGNIKSCELTRTYTKKYLTEALARQYDGIPTFFGGLFNHCIRANAFYPKSLFPKASDPDCYSTFSSFFNPIILESNHTRKFMHSCKVNYGSAQQEIRYRFHHHLIKGYRVRFSRNLEDFPFSMLISVAQRKEIEITMMSAFKRFPKSISGTYYKLKDISKSESFNFLDNLNLIPRTNNPIKKASRVYRDWPDNRGIFVASKDVQNPQNVLTILVNEADHFQVSCLNYMGIRLDYCYDRAVIAMQSLDKLLNNTFSKLPNYGFLSGNPQNVGCCMRVSANIFLRYLGEEKKVFNDFCIANNLNYRGHSGSGSKASNYVFDVSLKSNLNYSEIQILLLFTQRIKDLILEERKYDFSIQKPEKPLNRDEVINPIPNRILSSYSTIGLIESTYSIDPPPNVNVKKISMKYSQDISTYNEELSSTKIDELGQFENATNKLSTRSSLKDIPSIRLESKIEPTVRPSLAKKE